MLVTVVETPSYLAKAGEIMSAAERMALVDELAARPNAGVVIKGTGGLRKLRIGLDGRGKRGGGRVIYWFYNEGYPVVLLWAFAKNERADLTAAQRSALSKAAAMLREDFRRNT